MSRIAVLAGLVCLLLPFAARAESDYAPGYEPDPIPLSFGWPQVGIGFVSRGSGSDQFDGTLRWSPSKSLTRELRAGGFVELRTTAFDTFEFGAGPHVMYSISELWAVQLRTGLGTVADGPSYALAGVQFGNAVVSLTVTGRRYFDDHLEMSANLEITTALLYLPWFQWPGL